MTKSIINIQFKGEISSDKSTLLNIVRDHLNQFDNLFVIEQPNNFYQLLVEINKTAKPEELLIHHIKPVDSPLAKMKYAARDHLWCKAILETMTLNELTIILTKFNELRND